MSATTAELTTGANLWSWGSRITVSWQEREVVLVAAERFPTALGDHGQRSRDLDRLRRALQQQDLRD